MSFYFPNIDPIYLYKRSGSEEDPFIYLEEVRDIRHNSVILNEIPSFDNGVQVFDENNNKMTEVTHDTLNINEYRVDYTTGVIHFNSGMNGKKVTIKYYGTGYVDIPTTRIKIPSSNDDPLETLQDVLDRAEEGLEIINQVGSLTFMGEYDPDFYYKKWNFVTYNNKTFVAIQDSIGISPDNDAYWKLVSSGVGFVGVYDSSKTYNIGDLVTDEQRKNMYVSKIMNNNKPLNDIDAWELIITLDDTIDNLTNVIDQKINELNSLKEQLLNDENIRKQNEIDRENKLNDALNNLEDFKQDIMFEEGIRDANEEERKINENERISQENIRKSNEQDRIIAEQTRQAQEIDRQNAFNNAMSEINNTIQQADSAINQINSIISDVSLLKEEVENITEQAQIVTSDLNEFIHRGEYDSSAVYFKYNLVTYDGSTYIALQNSQGKSLDDEQYWRLIARRGRDGDTITINNIAPDENNNIDLSDLGLVTMSEVEGVVNQTRSELNNKMGELALLKTMRKTSLVDAINELKDRIDSIIDIIN